MENPELVALYLKNLWKWKCNQIEIDPIRRRPSLDVLRRTQSCKDIDELADNRLCMGAFRYFMVSETKEESSCNFMEAAANKITEYEKTGNTEMLIDLINYARLEYRFGKHHSKHFAALDDKGSHCNLKKV